MGKSEQAHYASPHEILDVLGLDGGEGLDFDPFGEVVHSDQEEFCFPFSQADGTDDVHSQMVNGHGDTMLWSVSGLR